MKAYNKATRKTVGEDRIAICPKFGCESIKRVKPLKCGFLGFGKYPKCKKHHIPLVYVDERIGDFVDAALACLFDRVGLPSNDLLNIINTKFPEELETFVRGWVYCITVGRGASIVSCYMDSISNAYLKQLTKKQIKNLKKLVQSKTHSIYQAIRKGMNEITNQYTRLLKHLRTHSEVLIELNQLKPLSKDLWKVLFTWQETILKDNEILHSTESKHKIPLAEAKTYYDQILNAGTCRCLLGLSPESKEVKKSKLTAFDRFSAYYDFYLEELTEKFTKSDIEGLIQTNNNIQESLNKDIEIPECLKRKYHFLLNPKLITAFNHYTKYSKNLGENKSPNFGTRYITKDFKNWLDNKENSQELQKICFSIIKRNEIINFIIDLIQTTNLNQTQIVEVLNNLGLSFNPETVKNVALKHIYQGNMKLYSKRFPRGLHRRERIVITKSVSKDYDIPGVKAPQIFIYDNKFRLSINFVKTLSEITYNLLLRSGLKGKQNIFKENIDIEKKVKNYIKINNILDHSPINNPNFKQFLDKTIKDFTVIISSLVIYNEKSKGELFKIKSFAQELIKRNYNLESALFTLRSKILPEILNHLNQIFTDFNLKMLSKRVLEQDEIGKVCGYCGIKKPWSEFQKISKGGYVSKCKKCMSIYGEIIKYKKKLRLLFEMQNGRFKGKCFTSSCSADFLSLPTFDFHHPSKKNHSWIKLLKKKYQTIKDLLEEDGVIPLCKNCHAPKQQSILLDYKNLILSQYLFRDKSGKQKNAKEINNMIDEAILNYPNLKDKLEIDSQYIGHVKYMIKSWIRKRAIVEQLYGGKCINCGETNLSSLTFHHINPDKKKDISSGAFRKLSIKQLANKMIQEECICLCANCHTMIEATIFREHSEEIFVDMGKKEIYVKKINYFYEKLTKNIQKEYKRIIKASQKFPVIDYLE